MPSLARSAGLPGVNDRAIHGGRAGPSRHGEPESFARGAWIRGTRGSGHARVVAALAMCGIAVSAGAQDYPSRPIRLVVPYPPGASSNDILGRGLAQRLSDALRQQVVVDNRSGASGNVGSEFVAKAPPDGYTLLIGVAGPLAVGPSVYRNLGYDPIRDLAPIAMFASVPYVMAVNAAMPATGIRQFIALAKSRPGQINFASSGNGGTPHLCGELFKTMAGVDMVHVPYKGGALAMVDLLSGQVPVICTGLTALAQHIKSGRLRALGVAALKRSALMPDVPTISEQGLPGFEVNSWTGVMAPARTPQPIVRRLHAEIAKIVEAEDMKQFLATQGAEPALMGPEAFGAYLEADTARWAKVVRAAKLTLD
jgi:tripartite-type tricarboxylate transporter receptor subunit TctC